MHLETLQLVNFKNYAEAKLDFSSKINVLVGKNGSGKTNLMDAIHYLSLTKSAFSTDNFSIRIGEYFFSVMGSFRKGNDTQELHCSMQSGSRKIFREGVNEYQKLSEHIGKYPVVLIAPDDTELVKEGSESRRRFFDSMISQLDHSYLEGLMQYNHALRLRNSLLKMFADMRSVDDVALESYDHVLVKLGNALFEKRKQFVEEYLPLFRKYYNLIVDHEHAQLHYSSELTDLPFQDGLNRSHNRDLQLQRTSFGIHRDDYHFKLGPGDLKRLGSQGQQKSFVIALKLAQFEIIQNKKKFKPLLLMDDVFDKLDDFRISRLLDLIKKDELGQLFITDARPDRTAALLRNINVSATIFTVDNGVIKKDERQTS